MKTTIITDMKNIFLSTIMIIALLFAACSVEENEISKQPVTGTFTLTVNASKGEDEVTRALSLDGSTLKATWKTGDAVTVYNVTRSAALSGSLTAQSDGKSTTLLGSLTGTIAAGDNLKLTFLSPSYSSQDGTLAGIASSCDYAEATVTVSAVSTSSITTSDATFTNQQAIVEFTLKDKATSAAINATSMTIYAGTNTINVTPALATDVIYVAIPSISSQTVYLSATSGSTDYIYEKANVSLTNGKYYGYIVSMDENPSAISQPLTFEAKVADVTVTFMKQPSLANQIQYSTDGSTWNDYSSPIVLANIGDKVYFRGDNPAYGASEFSNCNRFSCSGGCYVYGNIMSLVNSTGYATATVLTADYSFSFLFGVEYPQTNYTIYSHPIKKMVLPATTLKDWCYRCMFSSCTNITTAPELPATILAKRCYSGMFSYCPKLTKAPILPATTLAENCYNYMFGFSGLTSAPALPATTLAENCYRAMFQGTNLITAPLLPATVLAPYCYSQMFDACNSLIEAPSVLPAANLEKSCYAYMFYNCTSLAMPPSLPATTLAECCYEYMFYRCFNLATAPELPATKLAVNCYNNMFSGCDNLTTAPALPATKLETNCYKSMFSGCDNLTTAPALPATKLATDCYNSMFSGCDNLTTAPELPATTLANSCYRNMFDGCTNLKSVKCLATNISAFSCTTDWLDGVSATGTFTKAAGVDWSGKTGSDGIPSGWTVLEE